MAGERARRLRAALTRDEVRIPLQTAGAVLLAYVATLFADTGNMTWAVFSALFVVQASIGGTVHHAVYRVLGAALGALLGVLAVMLPGSGALATLAKLVLGVGVMSVVAARWQNLAYGLVTVAIIIVSPDLYLLEGALEKFIMIAIGSACGMVAALAVFPVSARRRAEAHLGDALHACAQFLQECLRGLLDEDSEKTREADQAISRHLARARDMREQALSERAPGSPPDGAVSYFVDEVERFRFTLSLIDRFSDQALAPKAQEHVANSLNDFAKVVGRQIDAVATAIVSRTPCEYEPEVEQVYEEFCTQLEQAWPDDGLGRAGQEHLIAIKEALASMINNLQRLCEGINRRYGESPHGP